MIEKFLKAKHWQLFLLTFGIPLILQVFIMGFIMSKAFSGENPDLGSIMAFMKVFPLIMIIFISFFFGWFWSIGVGLDKFIPDHLKLKVGRFKFFLLFPLFYFVFFSIIIVTTISGFEVTESAPKVSYLIMLVIPLHLFSMFCMLYCLYFVAKTIKTAELQKQLKRGDFIGEFFLIWFYPIGIWFIQPIINTIVEDEEWPDLHPN